MKKTLLYSSVGVAIGLMTLLVPLVTFAEIKAENNYLIADSISKGLRELEGSYGLGAKFSGSDLEVLALSLVVAMTVYFAFKRKVPHEDHEWVRIPP